MLRQTTKRLNLSVLEDRSTPASVSFLAGTLTITPASGDTVTVDYDPGYGTPGHLRVSDGVGTVFGSNPSQMVQNVVVNGANVNDYSLTLNGYLYLNNFTIGGARVSTTVMLNAPRLTGHLTFNGTGLGNDIFTIGSDAIVGGNVTLNLGNGMNRLSLQGLDVGRDLLVSGGTGDDLVGLGLADNINVGGSMRCQLGGGENSVFSESPTQITIGRDFTYTGGSGRDSIVLASFPTTLFVGGSLTATMRGVGSTALLFDTLSLGHSHIGGNLTYAGGVGGDILGVGFGAIIGGNVTFSGAGGINLLGFNNNVRVGGNVTVNGGASTDQVILNGTTINRNLTVNLGNDDLAGGGLGLVQQAEIGAGSPVTIAGNVSLRGGRAGRPRYPATDLPWRLLVPATIGWRGHGEYRRH